MTGVSLSWGAFYVRATVRQGLCFESNDDLSTELMTLGQAVVVLADHICDWSLTSTTSGGC